MSTFVIHSDKKKGKILKEIAEQLGAEVTPIAESQYEDLLLGAKMIAEQTGETIDRELIFKQFRKS